jgi:formate dehydrogenase subunit gamma
MAETTRQPEPARGGRPVRYVSRFDRVVRVVHWVNAVLFAVLLFTGLALYSESVTRLVGRRALMEQIHIYCGLALPVPLAIGVVGWWGRGLRADLRRLNRWSRDDRRWMRSLVMLEPRRTAQRRGLRLGKFNAGQKLNAAFVGGAILVMLGTGAIMKWYHPWPLSWRTGATFVHDWLALAIAVMIVGHITLALMDREALSAMVRGKVSRGWARRHAPQWLDDEVDAEVTVEDAELADQRPSTARGS